MSNIKILVTGLNGLIGWHVFRHLQPNYQVLGTYAKQHSVLQGDSFKKVDLDSFQQIRDLLESFQPDYVVHTRGICDLDLCESMPEMAQKINVQGIEKLIKAIDQVGGVKKLIYTSTDHVFNGDRGGYHEDDEPCPKHVYGQTKWEAEKRIQASKIPYLIIRPGLVIGESFQGNKGPRDFLFARIRANKPTHLFTDEWRSPILAEDLAAQIVELVFSEQVNTLFHIAGPEVENRFDLGKRLALEWGLSTEMIFPRKREEDVWAHIRPENISLKSIRDKPKKVEVVYESQQV